MIEHQENKDTDTTKLYSQKAISIATFFGGPLAAGVLARQNFINLGKEQLGRNALIMGLLATILLIVGILAIPENIADKLPNAIIPLVYTAIIYFIIENFQGALFKEHKENNREFYSNWKATGIGVICMLLLIGSIAGYTFLIPDDFDTKKYDDGITQFNKNEEKALELFSLIETSNSNHTISFIDNYGIPAWQKNLKLLGELDAIDGLHKQYLIQNEVLREYCKLRIETFKLIRQAITENSNQYDIQIQSLNDKIEEVLNRL